MKQFLLKEGTDPKYGARHLKRAIERHVVFPLANLVATGQVKLGDFIRIDIEPDGRMKFVKEAEGALVPVLLEKYGPEFSLYPQPRKRHVQAVAATSTPQTTSNPSRIRKGRLERVGLFAIRNPILAVLRRNLLLFFSSPMESAA